MERNFGTSYTPSASEPVEVALVITTHEKFFGGAWTVSVRVGSTTVMEWIQHGNKEGRPVALIVPTGQSWEVTTSNAEQDTIKSSYEPLG